MSELDHLSSIRELIKSEMIDINTSIQGEVISYSAGFATVKPLAKKIFKDGSSLPYPLIYKVPVRWPSFNGGFSGFKAPIKAGDKVLVIFSQQAADGGDDRRRFDLTDAYAVPASNEVHSGGLNNEDTVMWFGTASIRITESGKIIITAPEGIEYVSPKNSYTGEQIVDGKITGKDGLEITGTVVNNTKNISSTHTHTGVQQGAGTTGQVS